MLSVTQTALALGITRAGAYKLIHQGRLTTRKIAGVIAVTPESIEEYQQIRKPAGRPKAQQVIDLQQTGTNSKNNS